MSNARRFIRMSSWCFASMAATVLFGLGILGLIREAMTGSPPPPATMERHPVPQARAMEEPASHHREVLSYKSLSFDSPHRPVDHGSRLEFEAGRFRNYGTNPLVVTAKENRSTFSLDVDTASYTVVRGYLDAGRLPPKEAVRVEECVNYFKYADDPPKVVPFALHLEAAPSPFRADRHLLRIGIRARDIPRKDRRPATLTLVVDTSGSMNTNRRLQTVREALTLLLSQLQKGDVVGIVEYSSEARVVLEHTDDRDALRRAIDELHPRQSTNVEAGLDAGFRLAGTYYRKNAVNRVLLLSDGVANVGATQAAVLLKKAAEFKQAGIRLSTIGVGMDTYNDVLLEQLADRGDGSYYFVDGLGEAKRVFVENLTGTLQVVGKDAKVQVEFDPKVVLEYRLLGYENRILRNRDYRDEKVDAGEVGAGHTVTALYELKLAKDAGKSGRVALVSLRYKDVDERDESVEISRVLSRHEVRARFRDASARLRLAATAAQFAEILRRSEFAAGQTMDGVLREGAALETDAEEVAEFLILARKAGKLLSSED